MNIVEVMINFTSARIPACGPYNFKNSSMAQVLESWNLKLKHAFPYTRKEGIFTQLLLNLTLVKYSCFWQTLVSQKHVWKHIIEYLEKHSLDSC